MNVVSRACPVGTDPRASPNFGRRRSHGRDASHREHPDSASICALGLRTELRDRTASRHRTPNASVVGRRDGIGAPNDRSGGRIEDAGPGAARPEPHARLRARSASISRTLQIRGTRQNVSTDHLRQNVQPSRHSDSARSAHLAPAGDRAAAHRTTDRVCQAEPTSMVVAATLGEIGSKGREVRDHRIGARWPRARRDTDRRFGARPRHSPDVVMARWTARAGERGPQHAVASGVDRQKLTTGCPGTTHRASRPSPGPGVAGR
jgi:hypothetical protein